MRLTYLLLAQFLFYSSVCSSQDQLCPSDMVVSGNNKYCIDRYEFPNKRGEKPFTFASGIKEGSEDLMDAEGLCANIGKRVCTRNEWVHACEGPEKQKYSYGNQYDPDACNTEKHWKPVDYNKVAKKDKKHLADLNQSEPSGNRDKCVSPIGAYDMVGNAEEWTKCDSGEYGWCLVGGYWATGQKPSCRYSIIKHAPNWRDYASSLRCCLDIKN